MGTLFFRHTYLLCGQASKRLWPDDRGPPRSLSDLICVAQKADK
ncbi:hypothetical protein B8V81_0044 [Paenibacillus pasadenensis]|uniref:Uncharacterized protein n=1 Tax=Paenibacillus pasadenensis TaxID=217090 RepID=A0A2N5NC39_9BACL|nr:hypothetical protein B8V81_0044 [Paenibacillus pasadenensis]